MKVETLLGKLSRGFRSDFLNYDELTAQLEAWSSEFPEIVRLTSIGRSGEGRELWLLTLGREPDRVRPAVWVDGNMHASELCGSNVALAIAEDVVHLHVADDPKLHDLPHHVIERLRRTLFYILPRMSPDGAEAVLSSGRYVRSVTRDDPGARNRSRWVAEDVDKDGTMLSMRQRDAAGEYVECRDVPGWMLPRDIEDVGPFYKIYPEGRIENYDGFEIPSPHFLSDNRTDLNRNFPYAWMPEHAQAGAGEFPLSEPESRAVVAATTALPHLFAWLNLHTFGGVFIRPLGNKPDAQMQREDLAVFDQIGDWARRYAGYPMVSGYEEFTYEADKPLHGDLIDYAYHQRGCIAMVCELWDLFRQAGVAAKPRFVDHYSKLTRSELVQLAQWDRERNRGRALRSWTPFRHPQLGEAEIGGLDPRSGIWNPPPEEIAQICAGQSAVLLRVAALAPDIRTQLAHTPLGRGLTRIDANIENRGYLPTYILESARKLDWNEPLIAECETRGCALEEGSRPRVSLGHLDGWGRGLFFDAAGFHYQRSRGNAHRRRLSWLVRGSGEVRIRVRSCRTGEVAQAIEVRN